MTPVLFISAEFLQRFSAINGSVDLKLAEPCIYKAQITHLYAYLGKCLYDKLVSLTSDYIDDNNTGLGAAENAAYKTLLDDYLQQALMYWSLVELYPKLDAKIDNASTLRHVPDDSESLRNNELTYLINSEKDAALNLTHKMVDFICDNSSDYPEYFNCTECPEKNNRHIRSRANDNIKAFKKS